MSVILLLLSICMIFSLAKVNDEVFIVVIVVSSIFVGSLVGMCLSFIFGYQTERILENNN